ncbi:glutathione S-transferase [Absidia repens]|uniref:Glutathione S-transferase n=1 Tax=Absidia repens TaxID=90262 RepID=A0A1X2IQF7_9FUNG|nr:glutathione S-transferase [Absidia repens]
MTKETKPILYNFYRSSASYRVRIALAWKGIDYEYRAIDISTGMQKSEEYVKLNPSAKVPLFITKEGNILSQTVAILEYLDNVYPDRPMMPREAFTAAQVRSIVQVIACDIHPLQNTGVLEQKWGSDMEKKTECASYWIAKGFTGLEQMLAKTAGTYCVGDHITMADMFLAPMVTNAHRWKVDMKPFPIITRISDTLMTLPEFSQAHPTNQPDYPEELKTSA